MNTKQFLAIGFLLTAVNCTLSAHIFEDISLWWKTKEEEVVTHEHKLSPGAHISIENNNGPITISTWNKNSIMLEATKSGSEQSVKNTKIDLTYTAKGLSIKTVGLKPDKTCTISFAIIVPVDAHLDSIKTEQGNITVKNSATPLSLSSNYGDLTVIDAQSSINAHTKYGQITISTTSELKDDNKVLAFTERGAITMHVPEKTNAHLYATTLRGSVSTEQPITLDPRTTPINTKAIAQIKRDVQGSLGSGQGPTFKLHTNKGNIKLAVS